MDSYDIFKKLTVGVKFKHRPAKKIPIISATDPVGEKILKPIEIKKEKEVATDIALFSHSEPKLVKTKNKEFSKEKVEALKQEEINHYRNINHINVVGRHVPEPIRQFSDLKIGKDLLDNVITCGYEEPTPIQKQAIPIMMSGRQLLACAPTGSGKTAAFLLPIIHELGQASKEGCRVLIITPTRELAKQTQRECIKLSDSRGLSVQLIKKYGANASEQIARNMAKKIDILITTPNRLCFILGQDSCPISLSNVKWLIIDEADKLFETGVRSFRDQLNQILAACSNNKRKIAMFSATHTAAIAYWARHNMKGLITLTIGARNSVAETLEQELIFAGNEQGKLIALREIVRKGLNPPVLVFVQSKERAQQLFSELIYDGLNVDVIHADRTQLQRDNTVQAFREGRIWILICTELMGRGIDFKGVNLVINYDFPPSAISYIHRVGRAGRAGRPGKAITLFTTDDTVNLRSIVQVLKQSGCEVPEYMLALKKRGKKHRKQLLVSAVKREDITTDFIAKNRKKKLLKMKEGKEKKTAKLSKDNGKENKTPKPESSKQKKIVSKSKKQPKSKSDITKKRKGSISNKKSPKKRKISI